MAKGQKKGLTTRSEDYPQWYQEVISAAELAQHSPTRGCMIIRPYGYSIWENIQRELNDRIKATGHSNAYFPLLIPMSFLAREAEHVKGFAKECAVVTHHRLREDGEKGLIVDPEAALDEPMIIRPTSETVINVAFSEWVQSYRDLPLLINQWANVMRWEMRTRLFLRTAEFLWQEGHTAHESQAEAQEETLKMLGVYKEFAETIMAMPVIAGVKPPHERFPGADETYSIEAMMQDRKALQAGTSHNLGQNFSKKFDIKFLSREQQEAYAWTTSWGVSTRLIGGLIMTHSDDNGLVVPPRCAPLHIVIVPIFKNDDDLAALRTYLEPITKGLAGQAYHNDKLRVRLDDRDSLRPGPKFFEWERKGVPLRLEVGMRDLEKGELVCVRRDTGEKMTLTRDAFVARASELLDEIQRSLFDRALAFREANTRKVDSVAELEEMFGQSDDENDARGGFALCHYEGDGDVELFKRLKLTVRVWPQDLADEPGTCLLTGKPSKRRVILAKAY